MLSFLKLMRQSGALLSLNLAALVLTSTLANAEPNPVYGTLASELSSELDNVPLERLSARSGYGQPSIAIRTTAHEGTTRADDRRDHSRKLMTALRTTTEGRYRFVALDAIDKLIVDIKSQGLSLDEERQRIRALRANANADILVHGTVRIEGGSETLSYDAINPETGELLASTSEVTIAPHVIAIAMPEPQLPHPASPTPNGRYRPTVEEAERLLKDKGYEPGPVDGFMTPDTRAALSAYQRDSALPINGRLTRQVMKNLRRDTRVAYF